MKELKIDILTFNAACAKKSYNGNCTLNLEKKAEIWGQVFKEIKSTYEVKTGKLLSFDLVGIQEVLKVWPTDNEYPIDFCMELAKQLNLQNSFFDSILDSHVNTHPDKWGDPIFQPFNRVQTGNGVISKWDFSNFPWQTNIRSEANIAPIPDKFYPISIQVSQPGFYWSGNRNSDIRKIIISRINLSNELSLYFLVTHLSHLKGEDRRDPGLSRSMEASKVRLGEVENVLHIVGQIRNKLRSSSQKDPVILVGDFNSIPGSTEITLLEGEFQRIQPTWLSDNRERNYTYPKSQLHIDHIFISDPDRLITVEDCLVFDDPQIERVSDHLPVIARLALKNE